MNGPSILDGRLTRVLERLRHKYPRRPLVAYPDSVDWPERLRVNADACVVVQALLCLFRDAKAFVIESARAHGFDLNRSYGIDPRPLWRLEPKDQVLQLVKTVLLSGHQDIRESLGRMIQCLDEIQGDRLLGRDVGKMAFVRDLTGFPSRRLIDAINEKRCDGPETVVALRRRALELLRRQARRQSAESRKRGAVERMIDRIKGEISKEDVVYYHILQYARNFPRSTPNIDRLCQIYGDEILEDWRRLGDEDEGNSENESFEKFDPDSPPLRIRLAPRSRDFLVLGDRYGDCTALRARRQVDVAVANIHETVYAWMLDPFYCVLEICIAREPLLKAHLTPVLTGEGGALFVDAIEVVPKLRDELRGAPNPHLSQRLFRRRRAILDLLLDTSKKIGARMRVDKIYVDRFSNAGWVRQELESLDTDFYLVGDIALPFGTEPIRKLLADWCDPPLEPIFEEIQAMNLTLMDQSLRGALKETSLLAGDRGGSRALSGP